MLHHPLGTDGTSPGYPVAERRAARATGVAAIALAVGFNLPYAVLGVTFDYPAILREPPATVLSAFRAGGPGLILTWHAFTMAALALVPVSVALSIDAKRLVTRPALAIGAALTGALAGLAQAIGLSRWVFVVPQLAASGDGDALALLNAWGGIAIGEHIGQLLTALFALQLGLLQLGEHRRAIGSTGIAAALAVAAGTGEGLAIALGADGSAFSIATIAGFLLLALWLGLTGTELIRRKPAA